MAITLEHLKESKSKFKYKLTNKKHREYSGDTEEICKSIIFDCWNGKFFQKSSGHSNSFSLRDFCFNVEPLINLKFNKEVRSTLEWALHIYHKWNKITTDITFAEIPIDVYHYSCDGLPLLLRALRVSKSHDLIRKYHAFLNSEIERYKQNVYDYEKMHVYKQNTYSSFRHHYTRKSSMYDNSMVAILSMEIDKLNQAHFNLDNPFHHINFKKLLADLFWVGTHFLDDLSMDHHISSDANIIPFYFGVFTDKSMLRESILRIQKYKLDRPFPCKFTEKQMKTKESSITKMFLPNYQGDTNWFSLGLLFLHNVKKYDKNIFREYLEDMTEVVEKYKNIIEVFGVDGKPYKSNFMKSDEGIIWAAMYLDLLKSF